MKRRLLSILLVFACVALSAGCQQNRQTRTDVAMQEAGRLAPPEKALADYKTFVIESMEYSDMIRADEKKITVAKDLESRLNDKITPLIGAWNMNQINGKGTLIIKPILQGLRIVSGGARFWVGAMAGDSSVDMDLALIDKESGKEIAHPRIMRNASGYGGALSVGATDKNLLNYIVDIAYQYLAQNNTPVK